MHVHRSSIGGFFLTESAHQAAAYFAGFIAKKVEKQHLTLTKRPYSSCQECDHILGPEDREILSFVSFKQYKQNVTSQLGLKLCNVTFITMIKEMERVFLFYFENCCHLRGFTELLYHVMEDNCIIPKFCNSHLSQYLIRQFIKSRTFQSIKAWNSKITVAKSSDKIATILHK